MNIVEQYSSSLTSRKQITRFTLGMLGLAIATSSMSVRAANAIIVNAPTADVSVSANAHQGPNVANASVRIINGTINSSSVNNGGGVTTSPVMLGATEVSASASMNGFTNSLVPLISGATGSASLNLGQLKASVSATGPNNFGSPLGFSTNQIADTIYFNNANAGAVNLVISLSYDGTLTDTNGDGNPGGTATLGLSGCNVCGNSVGDVIHFAGDGKSVGDLVVGSFDIRGTFSVTDFGSPLPIGKSTNWDIELSGPGSVADRFTTTLVIPTGSTALGIFAELALDCRGGSQCNFTHTGTFGFGALPSGLSFTSASGAFLSGPSPVPLPAAIYFLGSALGGIGFARRHVV